VAPVPNLDVFISYRRQEASYLAAWLHDSLVDRIGAGRVFLDIDSIKPGVDFIGAITEAINQCAILLVIIGPQWLAEDKDGRRRLDDPDDPVRMEIEAALNRDIWVIPVLLESTPMPKAAELPERLVELLHRNALSIQRDDARADIEHLLTAVEELLGLAAPTESHAVAMPESTYGQGGSVAEIQASSGIPDIKRDRNQRGRLLSQLHEVYTEYIKQSVGESGSLQLQVPIDLIPAKTFRAVDRLLPFAERQTERLSDGTSLLEVFDRARGLAGDGLLVLGEPGAGKTTMLFELAGQLTDRARNNPEHPVPVYLPLSSWTIHRPPLARWLVEQLDLFYQVPPRLGRRWVEGGQILFLLDGLDEISQPSVRRACVEEVNRFNRFGRQARLPTVIGSRSAEYDSTGIALQLETAALLCPLDPLAVLRSMQQSGPRLQALAATLQQELDLVDLLRSPLLINMLSLTYVGHTDDSLPTVTGSVAERRRHLIANYVDQRLELERKSGGGGNAYRPNLTRRWLASLAENLNESNQTVFLLDRMRSSLLPSRRARRIITLLPSLIWGVTIGLVFGLGLELAGRLGVGSASYALLTVVLMSILGLVAGLVGTLTFRRRVIAWIILGLTMSFALSLFVEPAQYYEIAISGLLFAAFFGLLGEVAVRLIGGELQLVEHLSWSWKGVRPLLGRRLAYGLALAMAYNIPNWLASGLELFEALLLGLVFGTVLGLFFGLTLGLGGGLRVTSIPTHISPNEGVRRSARYGLAVGLSAALIVGVIFFASGLIVAPSLGLVRALAWGPAAGLTWGLATGLGAALQYWTLRLLIWGFGLAPLRYAQWLGYVVRLRLLYWGVGGGYVFIHRMVQEYFAAEARHGSSTPRSHPNLASADG
jgi:eukaryotic-like serine/threonine-protein kinase